jgi:hypothetical protein
MHWLITFLYLITAGQRGDKDTGTTHLKYTSTLMDLMDLVDLVDLMDLVDLVDLLEGGPG